jgi:glycosyltransferase involved in cell wall biosynthesis
MKILHTASPARIGGLEEVVIRLTSGLRTRGHDVAVAAIFSGDPGAHPFLEGLESEGVPVYPVVVPSRGYRREVAAVRELCQTFNPDIVHTHGYRPDVLHRGVARRLGIPAVTTLHGFTGGGWKNQIYEYLQLRAVRSFDAVVAVSRPMVERLSNQGVTPERIAVIPNAWSSRRELRSREEACALFDVDPEAFHVGWVGRLSQEKGVDVFLDAIQQMETLDGLPAAADGREFVASVVGDGRLREAMEARNEPRVRFHGAIPDAAGLFRAFDLLVLSSRTEGTPIVLFEAMSAEIPIVATSVGGVPDVLGPADALLVPSEDPAALAGAIRGVRADPDEARARAVRARKRVEEDFAPGPWLERHEALYATLVAAPAEPL